MTERTDQRAAGTVADRRRTTDDIDVAWLQFVALRFPSYRRAANRAWWDAYVDEYGLWDRCKDIGHEFWCRFGEGSCARRGPLSCNDDQAWIADEMMKEATNG